MATLVESLESRVGVPIREGISRKQIPELDGIRGIAILSVMVLHFSHVMPNTGSIEYVTRKATAGMWSGVSLFFVLSGFLITGILLDTRQSENYFSCFYTRRVLRILPLYYMFVVAGVLVLQMMGRPIGGSDLTSYIFYFYNWRAALGSGPNGMGHLWSLAVEEQFYLVWPLIVFLVPSRRFAKVCVGLIAASALFRVACVTADMNRMAYFATAAHVDELCLGGLAAMLVRTKSPEYLERWSRLMLAAGAVLVAFTAIGAKGLEPNKGLVVTAGMSGFSAMFFALVVQSYAKAGSEAGVARYLRTPWLEWLGKYSYGLYVLHLPICLWLESVVWTRVAGRPLTERMAIEVPAMAVGIAASCVVAYASYQFMEKKFLRLKPAYN